MQKLLLSALVLLMPLIVCAAQSPNAPFEGHIVKVVDAQTLQVLRQGKPVTVRIRDMPAGAPTERVRELVEQQTVTVIVYAVERTGRLVGEVILPTGRSLSAEVLPAEATAKYDKPLVPTLPQTEQRRRESDQEARTTRQEQQQTPASREDWDHLCKSVGESGYQIAAARDRGVPLTQILEITKKGFQSYPPIVAELYRNVTVEIYEKRWITPAVAQQRVEVDCIKTWQK